jgi:hypothetical protein
MALRTAMRGELMVRRRRKSRNFKAETKAFLRRNPHCAPIKKPLRKERSGFFWAQRGLTLAELLAAAR